MTDKIFADGLSFTPPNPKAPSFVKGKISINTDKFIEFLNRNTNAKGWVNLDVKESKGGKWYVELNTYQPGQAPQKSFTDNLRDMPEPEADAYKPKQEDEIDVKDIPF